jgi:putative N6-adenine-specific DNA methylase
VDIQSADFEFNLHINNKSITLSLNSSGESLNKRNYRVKMGPAPINEVLAAAMLFMSGYDGTQSFADYMCGSGTIAIEAALIATNTPPGALRKGYGFFKWPNFDKKLWEEVFNNAMAKKHKPLKAIFASDNSPMAISDTHSNINTAGLSDFIVIEKQKFENALPPVEPGIVMMNLPYDKRVELDQSDEFYKMVSDILKQKFKNNDAWILGPKTKSFKSFALKPSKKIALLNGSIECTLNNYRLY